MMLKSQRNRKICVSAGLILLIGIAFEPIVYNGYVDLDDPLYLTDNSVVQTGFNAKSLNWALFDGRPAYWHPLTWLSHMVDIELFGMDPLGHHVHSVLLHACSTVLLFWILCEITGSLWASAFIAMFFGIHPLRVESVAWASERKDVLCALFWMLTLLAYLHYARRGGFLRYLPVLLFFALGLTAKPMLVTLPLVLLVLDWWPLRRIRGLKPKEDIPTETGSYLTASPARLIAEKIPLLILAFLSCLLTYIVHQQEGSITSFPLMVGILNAMSGYTAYLSKIFVPLDLAVLYPFPAHTRDLWQPTIALIGLAASTGVILKTANKRPWLLAGWLWFLIILLPVIGLVQAGSQTMADRYSYLPSIGIGLIIVRTAMELTASLKQKKTILILLAGLAAIAMVMGTRNQLAYWKDGRTLYEHTLAVTKDNILIQNNLALLLLKAGDYTQAHDLVTKTLEVFPDSADTNIHMASLLMVYGQPDKAESYLRNAIQYKPDSAIAYYNLGLLQETQNRLEDAVVSYHQAIDCDPKQYQAPVRIGIISIKQGQLDLAKSFFEKSISINPDYAEAHRHLGWIQAVYPDSAVYNPSQAIQSAQKACLLTAYQKPDTLDTLAAAYAADGQYKEAVEIAQKAILSAGSAGKVTQVQAMEHRLKFYQESKPFIESIPK